MVMNRRAPDLIEAISDTRVKTLVVDDSPFMLKILAQILEETGNFELVGSATNGWQAIRQVSTLSPELVVMDFHLPHLNGIQATQYIKQREHPPIILIVTSDDTSATRSMAENAGADGFVAKDGKGNLRRQLRAALQSLFGPNTPRRMAPARASFAGSPWSQPNQEHGT